MIRPTIRPLALLGLLICAALYAPFVGAQASTDATPEPTAAAAAGPSVTTITPVPIVEAPAGRWLDPLWLWLFLVLMGIVLVAGGLKCLHRRR